MRVAVLPSGDVVWPTDVKSIRVLRHPSLSDQEESHFSVVVQLKGEDSIVVGEHLSLPAARQLGQECGNAINEALQVSIPPQSPPV